MHFGGLPVKKTYYYTLNPSNTSHVLLNTKRDLYKQKHYCIYLEKWDMILEENHLWTTKTWCFPKKKTYSANGPWDKGLNFIFPTKHVIPESLKFSHWLSEPQTFPTNPTGLTCGTRSHHNSKDHRLKCTCQWPPHDWISGSQNYSKNQVTNEKNLGWLGLLGMKSYPVI